MLTPSSGNPNEQIALTGKLSLASDSSTGVSGKDVTLNYFDGANWNTITTTTTGAEGSYSVNWVVPAGLANGPHPVKVVFSGDALGAAPQYLGSDSTDGGGSIFVLPEYALGGLAALGACFAALVVYKRKSLGISRWQS